MEERFLKGIARSRTRKDLTGLASGLPQAKWPGWVSTALEAARLAPSAVNRQPWRFYVDDKSITISVDSLENTYGLPKRLDCGIAMLHIELGARYAGADGNWGYLPPPQVARFTIK